ncbi:hypothetical protein BX600DRAFT_39526 [Xylariales sp. PMI_506]|nr:hypothetical protein BX600DRAFT_39526 [Xylariales sp. PMI_506]
MLLVPRLAAVAALAAVDCAASPGHESFGLSIDSARLNAPRIFNAVHNAMRQFGSSWHHNGMSFFPVTIPSGTILFHGSPVAETPTGLDWLAFEIEHAENFAKRVTFPGQGPDSDHAGQKVLAPTAPSFGSNEEDSSFRAFIMDTLGQGASPDPPIVPIVKPGYLHQYQATRPLQLLYLDGMAAGKTDMGTNDAEDYILCANKSLPGYADFKRAAQLCELAKEWQIDGFVRMEPGFEVIYCDFHNGGLNLLSASYRAAIENLWDYIRYSQFEWLVAASKRYHGIGGGRVIVDYSSMVSAFFYPVNLTNPNVTRSEHPRLTYAPEKELAVIKEHVDRVIARGRLDPLSTIDWQAVTDLIVDRYSSRLSYFVTLDSLNETQLALDHLLNLYIDFAEDDVDLDAARHRCVKHYLRGTSPRTPEDELIYAGIEGTMNTICSSLFEAREVASSPGADASSQDQVVRAVKQLMGTLQWSEWKECGPCQLNEVCMIAMWPFGNVEDHYNPSCLNASVAANRNSYWRFDWWGE